jgi:hypothetical protein
MKSGENVFILRNEVGRISSDLKRGEESGIIKKICQNELTNHTRVTAPVLMGFVHVLPVKLAALY